jgi:hypothetical protein
VKLYPNPAKSLITLKRGRQAQGTVKIAIYNLQQEMVYQTHLLPQEQGVGIPIESWSAGLYWVNLVDEQGRTAQIKWVKLP